MIPVKSNVDIAQELLDSFEERGEAKARIFMLWQNEEMYGDLEEAKKLEEIFLKIQKELEES